MAAASAFECPLSSEDGSECSRSPSPPTVTHAPPPAAQPVRLHPHQCSAPRRGRAADKRGPRRFAGPRRSPFSSDASYQVEISRLTAPYFRALEHAWLFLHALDNFTALARLVEFYVTAHNQVMPHSAFQGQTPDEMYFGTGGTVPADLASARKAAREERMKVNRAAACSVCFGVPDSKVLLLQRPRSRMS